MSDGHTRGPQPSTQSLESSRDSTALERVFQRLNAYEQASSHIEVIRANIGQLIANGEGQAKESFQLLQSKVAHIGNTLNICNEDLRRQMTDIQEALGNERAESDRLKEALKASEAAYSAATKELEEKDQKLQAAMKPAKLEAPSVIPAASTIESAQNLIFQAHVQLEQICHDQVVDWHARYAQLMQSAPALASSNNIVLYRKVRNEHLSSFSHQHELAEPQYNVAKLDIENRNKDWDSNVSRSGVENLESLASLWDKHTVARRGTPQCRPPSGLAVEEAEPPKYDEDVDPMAEQESSQVMHRAKGKGKATDTSFQHYTSDTDMENSNIARIDYNQKEALNAQTDRSTSAKPSTGKYGRNRQRNTIRTPAERRADDRQVQKSGRERFGRRGAVYPGAM